MSHSHHRGLRSNELLAMFLAFALFATMVTAVGIAFITGYLIYWMLISIRNIHRAIRSKQCMIQTAMHWIVSSLFTALCSVFTIVVLQSLSCNPLIDIPPMDIPVRPQFPGITRSDPSVYEDLWISLDDNISVHIPLQFRFESNRSLSQEFGDQTFSRFTDICRWRDQYSAKRDSTDRDTCGIGKWNIGITGHREWHFKFRWASLIHARHGERDNVYIFAIVLGKIETTVTFKLLEMTSILTKMSINLSYLRILNHRLNSVAIHCDITLHLLWFHWQYMQLRAAE